MSTNDLYFAIGILVVLMIIPLFSLLIVRWLVPLEPVVELAEIEEEVGDIQFSSLRDFWDGMVPHLLELRNRVTKIGLAILGGAIFGSLFVYNDWFFGQTLPEFIVKHFAGNKKLQGIAVSEVFVSDMGVAIVLGIAVAIPIIVYQIIAFFSPALHPVEKRVVYTAMPFVSELFLAGLAFGWFFTVPAAMQFLLNFGANGSVEIIPSYANFLSTITTLMLWNGVVFEIPAVVYLLARIGLVNYAMLGKTRRYAFAVIVVVAAIITPTGDPYNLLLLAIPMYLLYELGIQLSRFVPVRDVPIEFGV